MRARHVSWRSQRKDGLIVPFLLKPLCIVECLNMRHGARRGGLVTAGQHTTRRRPSVGHFARQFAFRFGAPHAWLATAIVDLLPRLRLEYV